MSQEKKLLHISIEKLKTMDYNPNEMPQSVRDHLKRTIKTRGFMQPLTVTPRENEEYAVIDGAHRLQALQELGEKEVPCWVVPGKTDKDVKIDLINMNKTKGEFDQRKYAVLVSGLAQELDSDKMKELVNIDVKEANKLKNLLNSEKVHVGSYERLKNKKKNSLSIDVGELAEFLHDCNEKSNKSASPVLFKDLALVKQGMLINLGWSIIEFFNNKIKELEIKKL